MYFNEHDDENKEMEGHDKCGLGLGFQNRVSVEILNKIWNGVAEEKKKLQMHGVNHTEEEYRSVCSEFQSLMNQKRSELQHAKKTVREQFVKITKNEEEITNYKHQIINLNDTIKDLKRKAGRLDSYKEEFKKASKRLRTIEEYVMREDCRTACTVDEYENTDPDLRMFFEIED